MLKFVTLLYSKYLSTPIHNFLKYLFLILVILALVISYVCVIQSFTPRYEYTLNTGIDENTTTRFDKSQKLEMLRNSDNPGNFTLSTDKNIVVEEGIFTLSWIPSKGASSLLDFKLWTCL